MADLKQIKVGDTTYNIEPYTAYLPLSGGRMSGDLKMAENSTSILLRSESEAWYSGIYANSTGDEVLGIVVANPRTHIMLGTANPISRPACTALTPAIDIKNGKVGINKRLGTDGAEDAGSYELDVNGAIRANGSIDASSARISNGLYVGTSITHNEQGSLNIGNSSNDAYVNFVEDVQIGDLIINAEDGHMSGIEKIAIGEGSSASDNDVVVGASASATGASVAVGYNSHCNSTGSVAVGFSAGAYNTNATAMGYSSSASGAYSIALGSNSTATNTHSTAVGYLARATAYGSIAVGSSPTSSGYYSIALGYGSNSNSTGAVAIGYGAKALFNYTIAIGNSPTASGVYGIALGYQAKATATAGVAIGYSTDATATGSVAIGYNPTSSGYYSIAAGYNSYASSTGAIAIGYSADATATGAIAIGYNPTASGIYSICLGYGAKSASHSIMIGANVSSSSATIEQSGIAIGSGASAVTDSYGTSTPSAIYAGKGAVAIGSAYSTITDGWAVYRHAPYARSFGVAIGSGATATGSNSVSLGTNTTSYGVVVGSASKAYGSNCIAIGSAASAGSSSSLNASSPSTGGYSIAIGYGVSAGVSSSRSLIKIGQTSHNTYFYAGTSASWSSGSDIRDKTNIQPIYGGIDLIKNIQPISFQYNYRNTYSDTGSFLDYDIEEHKKATKADDELKFGFAAQEVANYFDRVYGDEKINNIVGHDYEVDADTGETADYYSIAEGGFIPFLFQAIKEQQDVIESLEERIIKLENILTKEG